MAPPPDEFARPHLLRRRLFAASHRHRPQASGGRAVAYRALTVVTPAIGYGGRGPPAGSSARTHLAEEEAAGNRDRRQPPGGRPIAELAGGIGAPAVGPVLGGLAAGVEEALRTHAAEAESAGYSPRPKAEVKLPIANLPASAVAPAESPIAGGHAAAMVQARFHLPELMSASHPRGPHSKGNRRAVTDCAEGVAAPAIGPVVGGHATGMVGARAYLAEHECAHDRNRPGAAGIDHIGRGDRERGCGHGT
jgi:hypothetical protein